MLANERGNLKVFWWGVVAAEGGKEGRWERDRERMRIVFRTEASTKREVAGKSCNKTK